MRRHVGFAVASFLLAGCGVDDPSRILRADQPLAAAQRVRHVDVEFVTFIQSDEWVSTLAVRPGDPSLYAVLQRGLIARVDPPSAADVVGSALPLTDFDDIVLDIADQTLSAGEEGLVGLAFDPTGEFAYINQSRKVDGHSIVAEYAVTVDGFDPDSRRELFVLEQSSNNHNGGQLAFGPDGYLYLGVGDGAEFADLERTALDFSSPLGKILRIDPRPDGDQPYVIPADNPNVEFDGADPRVWARGLRNPYSFSFDPATGDLWIADVGQGGWEEINFGPATNGLNAGRGLNFGWSAFEGPDRFNPDQSPADHTSPRISYSHDSNGGCSAVADGLMVRDSALQALDDWYVYGDWCSGMIWALDTLQPDEASLVLGELIGFTDMEQTLDGSLFASARTGGGLQGGMISLVVEL
jgi:hypothetical protein